MSSRPPPLPGQDRVRLAWVANAMLPGAGLYLLGRRTVGAVLAGLFSGCFLVVLGLFLNGYAHYLSSALSDDLMKGDRLERINEGFHLEWLLTFAGLGGVIYLVSLFLFSRERKRKRTPAGPAVGSPSSDHSRP